jgi:hypothetical protein
VPMGNAPLHPPYEAITPHSAMRTRPEAYRRSIYTGLKRVLGH